MNPNRYCNRNAEIKDFGPRPFVADIDRLTKMNANYRTALWTGEHLQVTLMSIPVGGDIGLEIHENLDQFLCIESGCALIMMGKCKDNLNYQQRVHSNCAILVPACTWHNIVNMGCTPVKLYSIYAPPQHPFGTIHKTKEDAEASHNYHDEDAH